MIGIVVEGLELEMSDYCFGLYRRTEGLNSTYLYIPVICRGLYPEICLVRHFHDPSECCGIAFLDDHCSTFPTHYETVGRIG